VDAKDYFIKFGQYIDSLSKEEFLKLLEDSGLEDCPFEDDVCIQNINYSQEDARYSKQKGCVK
jgi:hypothetical protein